MVKERYTHTCSEAMVIILRYAAVDVNALTPSPENVCGRKS